MMIYFFKKKNFPLDNATYWFLFLTSLSYFLFFLLENAVFPIINFLCYRLGTPPRTRWLTCPPRSARVTRGTPPCWGQRSCARSRSYWTGEGKVRGCKHLGTRKKMRQMGFLLSLNRDFWKKKKRDTQKWGTGIFKLYCIFINMPIFQKKAFKKPGWQHWVIF